jgi:hypothetical protein
MADFDRRPLFFAFWFRALVAALGVLFCSVFVMPWLLTRAGGTVFEPVGHGAGGAGLPGPASAALPVISHPSALAVLALLAGAGLGYAVRLARLRRAGSAGAGRPPAFPALDVERPSLEQCRAIARAFLVEAEPLLAVLPGASPQGHADGLGAPTPVPAGRDAA